MKFLYTILRKMARCIIIQKHLNTTFIIVGGYMKKMLKVMALFALIANSLPLFAVDVTLSPIYTAVDLVRSALVTVVSPFASTTGLTAGVAEAEMRIVKDDAIRSLSGEERTDRLSSTIDFLRESIDELKDVSDEEIELTIIAAVE